MSPSDKLREVLAVEVFEEEVEVDVSVLEGLLNEPVHAESKKMGVRVEANVHPAFLKKPK